MNGISGTGRVASAPPPRGDVSYQDYVDALVRDVVRYVDIIDRKNDRYLDAVDSKNQAALKAALAAEQLARSVALAEIKGAMNSHNDLIRKGERERAETTAKMVTQMEFRPVADFVEGERGGRITSGKFWAALAFVATLAMTSGFGLASLRQSAVSAAISKAAEPSASESPRVVIPLPPAEMDEPAR